LQSLGYGATECRVGFAYGANDTNWYRLASGNVYIELLDVKKENLPANFVPLVRDLLDFLTRRLTEPFSSGKLR
jgi:hypothetical protein